MGMLRMEALGLPHLSQAPRETLYSHAQKAVARFESCAVPLKTGSLRILPVNESTIAIEGITSKNNRRFLLTVTAENWKLDKHTSAESFHGSLGAGDAALAPLAVAIANAYRTGRINKISNEFALSVREALFPKPVLIRGDEKPGIERSPDVVAAWVAVDTILGSPTGSKRMERAITDDQGKTTAHLLITYQEQKKSFIVEKWPFPRPYDSRPPESLTLTKDSVFHFDPDGAEPFSSKERSLEVFEEWMKLWGRASRR
jgi:hypothetical protein